MHPNVRSRPLLLATVLVSVGCASTRVITVAPDAVAPASAREAIPVASMVVVDATSVRLPMAVSGSDVAYAGVDRALEEAISRAALPVLAQRGGARRYELFVELIEARADYAASRLVVALTVRATLRNRSGNAYVAQTHARAAVSRLTPPESGANEVRAAADAVAAKLSGFLLGLEL